MIEPSPDTGQLIVICGCMFAGKTTRLIARLSAAADSGQRVLACKHSLDDRYHPSRLVTHDKRDREAIAVGDPTQLIEFAANVDVLGIDEAHFFGRPLIKIVETIRATGCNVVLAGLDNDAWGQPFTPLPELKAVATKVDLLTLPCTSCGSPARYSQRMVPLSDDDMVGGLAEYEPRCPKCFTPIPGPKPVY